MSSSAVVAPVEGYTNILENAVQPVDLRKFQQVFGAAEYVAFEVLISYFARYLFKVEKRTLMELDHPWLCEGFSLEFRKPKINPAIF